MHPKNLLPTNPKLPAYRLQLTAYRKRGITLPELVVYVTIFIALSLVATNSISQMGRAFVRYKVNSALAGSATSVLERAVREVRFATSIDDGQSIYDNPMGRLFLAHASSSATTTVEFLVAGGKVLVKENGGQAVPLTGETVIAESLVFRKAATTTRRAIKVELGLRDTRSGTTTVDYFYTTAVMRGNY